MESRIKDWGIRLEICTTQLQLAISAKEPGSIDEWLKEGFEALEHCEAVLVANGLDPKDIDKMKSRITNFKLICKDND